LKGLINLALIDLDKWDNAAHPKSYIVDISPKYADYLFAMDGCSSFLIKCCLNNF